MVTIDFITEIPRKTRYLEFLSEYDFDIKHINIKENKVVDGLNIRVHIMHATTISIPQFDLKSKILNDIVTCQLYLQVEENLHQEYVQQKFKEYKMREDGILMHKNIIYVPISGELKKSVLK